MLTTGHILIQIHVNLTVKDISKVAEPRMKLRYTDLQVTPSMAVYWSVVEDDKFQIESYLQVLFKAKETVRYKFFTQTHKSDKRADSANIKE